jgi:hypothetical protein
MQVSREHVVDILARAGLTAGQERRVLALDYPADYERVLELFATFGIYPDELTSRLGGSP